MKSLIYKNQSVNNDLAFIATWVFYGHPIQTPMYNGDQIELLIFLILTLITTLQ